MVFSSLPSYLDPPDWPQQQPAGGLGVCFGGGGGGDHEISHISPTLMAPPLPLEGGGDGRYVHMLDCGRMTKLPQPDTSTQCPRCESTNTKFCYFNNYSLSQPRHFCKTCRRYWTKGGALRSLPVGGGCRRNKKSSKGSRDSGSKSPAAITSSASKNTPISPNNCTTDILGHFQMPRNILPPHFPILPSLHHYGGGDLGLTFGDGNGTDMINLSHDGNYPSNKFAHFPHMEASNGGMYGENATNYGGQVGEIKMEENHHHHHQQQQHQGMNLSRNFLGISGNDQFVGTSNVAWGTTDLSGFTSSSTTHLL